MPRVTKEQIQEVIDEGGSISSKTDLYCWAMLESEEDVYQLRKRADSVESQGKHDFYRRVYAWFTYYQKKYGLK